MARRLAWVVLAGLGAAPAAEPVVPPPTQLNAGEPCDDLALAAACLDRGEDTAAVGHLSRHLTTHPDRPFVRFSLAELHWRRDRLTEAGTEYERFIREVPPRPGTVNRLVQAHARLVAVAGQAGDAYAEHLHRGIGLYLVAGQDSVAAEGLLCKAAGELTLASRDRPTEARPHWYLHLTWARLAQSQPADRHLGRAAALAASSDLAPHERRDLAVAGDASAPR